jgi:hypothetical protein
MSDFFQLTRLRPFEGLALTAQDLLDEQAYHRRNLARHAFYLHGHGIVQGLQVEVEQRRDRHLAIIQAGYGITRQGQGVLLPEPVSVWLDVPGADGEYMLWLFHVEAPEAPRPLWDMTEQKEARVKEGVAPRLHAIDEGHADGVALTRIDVRLGRMARAPLPVPRAGRQERAAESYLKPRVAGFIRVNRDILRSLLRTTLLRELDLASLGFHSALISSEYLLIEEGTADRVLYRIAGSLIGYAHDFYSPLPPVGERMDRLRELVRRVHAEVPGPDQADERWLRWFETFQRLLPPLEQLSRELEETAEARR